MGNLQINHPYVVLAQDGVGTPPPPGETVPGELQQDPGAAGAPGGTGGGARSPFGSMILIVPIILIVMLMIFSSSGQKKEKRRRAAMLAAISKHDKVQTVGGVIGSVVEVKDAEIVLKVDEATNTKMRFARSAIQRILTDNTPVEVK
ncbi:MAG: preprotein translocase subunit YajC [Phycisphaerales bacterium]|nr:preprotein translocase subunit YajC [Phycisphaerales bacterium]